MRTAQDRCIENTCGIGSPLLSSGGFGFGEWRDNARFDQQLLSGLKHIVPRIRFPRTNQLWYPFRVLCCSAWLQVLGAVHFLETNVILNMAYILHCIISNWNLNHPPTTAISCGSSLTWWIAFGNGKNMFSALALWLGALKSVLKR